MHMVDLVASRLRLPVSSDNTLAGKVLYLLEPRAAQAASLYGTLFVSPAGEMSVLLACGDWLRGAPARLLAERANWQTPVKVEV